jgi:hypothetical protein
MYSNGLEYVSLNRVPPAGEIFPEHFIVSDIGKCTDVDIIIPEKPDSVVSFRPLIVYEVDGRAFSNVPGIRSISLPNTIKYLRTFMGTLDSSVQIIYRGTREEWSHVIFTDSDDKIIPRYVQCLDGTVFMCGDYMEDPRFEFTSNGDGTCYVSGIGTATRGVIPRYSPAGDLVTAIGEGALMSFDCTVVGIPDSVTRIGNNAFRNASFEQIIVPNSVTHIGDYAFADLESMEARARVLSAVDGLPNLTCLGVGVVSTREASAERTSNRPME